MVTKKTVRKEAVSHRGTSGGGELHMPPFQHYDYAMDHVSALSFSTPCPGYSPQIAGPPMHPLAPPPSKKAKRGHHQSTASSSKKSRVALQVLPTPVKAMSKAEAAAVPMQNPYSTSRGLRHFSMKVCEKVEEKGTTTYNEVADELVKELKAAEKAINAAAAARGEKIPEPKPKKINKKTGKAKKTHDDKNIRRRVYDALNVLMAMDIITKEKKEITWRGLPGNRVDQNDLGDGSGTDSATGDGSSGAGVFSPNKRKADGLSRHQRLQQMQDERTKRQEEIMQKRECLQQLMTQNVCLQNLLARNHAREVQGQHRNRFIVKREGPEDDIAHQGSQDSCDVKEIIGEKIPLPFLIVNTDSRAVAQCEMCPERTNVSFDFSLPFEINDDNEILKRLGMSHTSMEALQRSLPPDLHHYAWRNGLLQALARS